MKNICSCETSWSWIKKLKQAREFVSVWLKSALKDQETSWNVVSIENSRSFGRFCAFDFHIFFFFRQHHWVINCRQRKNHQKFFCKIFVYLFSQRKVKMELKLLICICLGFVAASVMALKLPANESSESVVLGKISSSSPTNHPSNAANVTLVDHEVTRNVSRPLKFSVIKKKKKSVIWKIIKYGLGAIVACVIAYYISHCCLGFWCAIGAFFDRS